MVEVSAGGLVFFEGKILILRRTEGSWVLPKGHVEKDEAIYQAAIREVKEEADVDAKLKSYIGYSLYEYYNNFHRTISTKIVYWFEMLGKSHIARPLESEGFNEAVYVPVKKALSLLVHQQEIGILEDISKVR